MPRPDNPRMLEEPGAPPARLVFVNRYFFPDESATSQMLTDLAIGLVGRGTPVRVICSRSFSSADRTALPARETLHGVAVQRVWTTRFGRHTLAGRALDYLTFYLACGWALWRTVGEGEVIVAKTDPPLVSLICALVARGRRARLVNWQQDVFPEVTQVLGGGPLLARCAARLAGWRDRAMRFAEINVVIGERMREHFLRRGIPDGKLCTIPNWSAVSATTAVSQSRLRRRLSLERHFVVCYSGNLGRAHEFDTMLEAAALLKEQREIVFLVIAEGARVAAFRRAVAKRQLRNVLFQPLQPRELLADSLSGADVHVACLRPELEGLVVPSKFYGMLGAARPVLFVGDRAGELARLVEAVDCGFAIASGDAPALAAAIRSLRDSPQLRAAMGERARALMMDRFTRSHGLARWHLLLGRLLEPASHPATEHDADNHSGVLKPS